MSRDRAIQGFSLALCAAALAGASHLMAPINRMRAELQLTYTPDVAQNLPPEIAFTQVALGSFRGLAVDYLWTRATRLQEEGKYYESMQLSEWITALQPRFAQVWAYHAWNMAYNISGAVYTPPEKWRWVQAGIALLRDKGIPHNPREPRLYRELAYLYFHKVGKFSVDAHWYYKAALAREWHALLGPPAAGSAREAAEAFRRRLEAPDTLDELLRAHPDAGPQLRFLRGLGFELDAGFLEELSVAEAVRGWKLSRTGTRAEEDAAALERLRRMNEWLDDAESAAPREALLAFARRKVLRERHGMDPALMAELMETYGPIDWRHPDAHAVYWTELGLRRCEGQRNPDDFEILMLHRVRLLACQSLALSGHISYDPFTGYYSQLPEPRLFDAYEKCLLGAARSLRQPGEKPDETPRPLQQGHRGFLELATQLAYLYGSRAMAAEYYEKARARYGEKSPGAYSVPLDDFVFRRLTKGLSRIEQARPAIMGLLMQAMTRGLAPGRTDVANRFIRQAQRAHRRFQEGNKRQESQRLPSFDDMVADALARCMRRSPSAIPPLVKARIWRRMPASSRRKVFDRVRETLYAQTAALGFNPRRMFPEPPGMDEYREQQAPPGKESEPDAPRPVTR